MTNVQKTKNYGMFKSFDINREVKERDLKVLVNSIKAVNLLQFRPMIVDSKMRIVDGQHRLAAARLLDLEIYYQVNEQATDEDIMILNQAQKAWVLEDYINAYAKKGNTHYVNLLNFCDDNDVTIKHSLALFNANKGGKDSKIIRQGKFVFPNQEEVEKALLILENLDRVLECVDQFCIQEKTLSKTHKFKRALMSFLRLDAVDPEVLLRKIKINFDKLHICANVPSYFMMMKDLYNWKNRAPINIDVIPSELY